MNHVDHNPIISNMAKSINFSFR